MNEIFFSAVGEMKSEIGKYLPLVSAERQKHILNHANEGDRQNALLASLIVRLSATGELNLKNSELAFSVSEGGKPHLICDARYDFCISHTKNAVAVAVSSGNVGVDIEKIEKFPTGVAKRFLPPCLLSETMDNCGLYMAWTKLEAYAKYTGKGIAHAKFGMTPEIAHKIKSITVGEYVISYICEFDGELNFKSIGAEEILSMAQNELCRYG